MAGHFAFVGGFAGGFVKRTGWTIILMVIISWLVLGLAGIVLFPGERGFILGVGAAIFLGTIPGGYLGYRMGIHWESQKPDRKAPGRTMSTSLWDREIDG